MSTTVILIKVEERRVQLQHREESFLGIEVSRSNVDIHLPAAVGEVGVESEEVRRHTLKVAPRPIQWAAKMPSWPQLLECAEARLSGTGFRIAPQTVMRRGRALPTARHLHLLIFRVTARDGRMASCSIHCLHARFARVLRMQAAKEAKQCEPMHVHGLGRGFQATGRGSATGRGRSAGELGRSCGTRPRATNANEAASSGRSVQRHKNRMKPPTGTGRVQKNKVPR